jgi:hypothetical protein
VLDIRVAQVNAQDSIVLWFFLFVDEIWTPMIYVRNSSAMTSFNRHDSYRRHRQHYEPSIYLAIAENEQLYCCRLDMFLQIVNGASGERVFRLSVGGQLFLHTLERQPAMINIVVIRIVILRKVHENLANIKSTSQQWVLAKRNKQNIKAYLTIPSHQPTSPTTSESKRPNPFLAKCDSFH